MRDVRVRTAANGQPNISIEGMTMAAPDPDPNCPDCHGTGQVIVYSPLLDRVDEFPSDCPRCAARASRAKHDEPPDTSRPE